MTRRKANMLKRTQIYILVEDYDPPGILQLRGDFELFKDFIASLQHDKPEAKTEKIPITATVSSEQAL